MASQIIYLTQKEFDKLNKATSYANVGMIRLNNVAFMVEPEVVLLFEHTSVDGGVIRLETWPEGLVLWVNGKIKYKYWEDTDK